MKTRKPVKTFRNVIDFADYFFYIKMFTVSFLLSSANGCLRPLGPIYPEKLSRMFKNFSSRLNMAYPQRP